VLRKALARPRGTGHVSPLDPRVQPAALGSAFEASPRHCPHFLGGDLRRRRHVCRSRDTGGSNNEPQDDEGKTCQPHRLHLNHIPRCSRLSACDSYGNVLLVRLRCAKKGMNLCCSLQKPEILFWRSAFAARLPSAERWNRLLHASCELLTANC